MGKFDVGDRVRVIDKVDDINLKGIMGTIRKINAVSSQPLGVEFDEDFSEGHNLNGVISSGHGRWTNEKELELIEKKSPSKNVSKMKKTIYNVIAVDKKTGKTTKNETISADNEQQAILKAFGVDAENTFIKTTEIGDYEEDKPLKAVLEKPAK